MNGGDDFSALLGGSAGMRVAAPAAVLGSILAEFGGGGSFRAQRLSDRLARSCARQRSLDLLLSMNSHPQLQELKPMGL